MMYKNIFAAIAVALMVNACESFGPIHIDLNGSEDSSQNQDQDDGKDDSGATTPSQAGSSAVKDGYVLVWEDLFDGTSLDSSVWNIEVNGDGGGNNELQFYRAENVSVGKDQTSGRNCLILTAKRESYGGKAFTSGRVNSKNKKAFTHGKVEALIKLPSTANGLWPAFWMMGNDYDQVGWPRCGEIDILEMGNSGGITAGTQDRFFNGACHWGFYKDVGGGNWAYPNYAKNSTWSYSLQDGEYHLFTLIWDESALKMYVDYDKYPGASPYFEMGITSKDDDWGTGYYFHHDFFILFNLAVGGNFTGIHNALAITALPSGSE
ncbi:MAG: family 16 glycosylhydrolase, partial [Candidatus Cryptobacteroides sp.]